MTTFVRINNQRVNPDHIIRVEVEDATPARTWFDEDEQRELSIEASPTRAEVVLSELQEFERTTYDGDHVDSIAINHTVKVSGAEAERLLAWIDDRTVTP